MRDICIPAQNTTGLPCHKYSRSKQCRWALFCHFENVSVKMSKPLVPEKFQVFRGFRLSYFESLTQSGSRGERNIFEIEIEI